jgi:hypothetical protein
MRRSQFCTLAGAALAIAATPAFACDFCGLPDHAKHRVGKHALILKTPQSHYAAWHDVRIVVGIVNESSKPLPIDTSTPIWKQSSLHIGGTGAVSFADVQIAKRATVLLAPGATYYFRGPDGRTEIPVARWGGPDHRLSGRYSLDVTYDKVDSATIEFTIA